MAPVRRGLLATCLDRALSWASGLPPELSSYSTESVSIPVADGVSLTAVLYQPLVAKPAGTILIRSSYGIGIPMALSARTFAARGYQVLISSCRGTAGSERHFEPARHEAADGQAVVAWMRKQPWYTGAFAMLGASYLGYVQWAMLADPPPDMKAAVINTAPHKFSSLICGTGALSGEALAWADFLAYRPHHGAISQLWYLRSQQARLRPVLDAVPLLPAVDKYFENRNFEGEKTPTWLRDIITHPDPTDPFWAPMQHEAALERANIPILLTTGWYDLLLEEPMKQYARLAERGCNVALTVGPWTHLGAGGRNTPLETLGWLDEHLAQKPGSHRPAPVRIFVTGAQEWRDLPKWPPPTSPHELFLHPGKQLSQAAPSTPGPDTVFKFDPADPTPSIGAPQLFDNATGQREPDTALAQRPDVAVFTTAPLQADLEVCGRPTIELHHTTSPHRHADLLVLLSEVDDKTGVSRGISETFIRLDSHHQHKKGAGEDGESDGGLLRLTLRDCAHRFRRGTRVRLLLAGGSHPRYLRNPGTGAALGSGDDAVKPVWHTIGHGPGAVSRVVLPVTAAAAVAAE